MTKAKINPEFTYKTRDGKKVNDLQSHYDIYYPFTANVMGKWYTYTEQGYFYDSKTISNLDLIKQPVKKTKPVVKEVQKEVMKTAGTTTTAQKVNQVQTQGVQHKHHDMIVDWAKNTDLKVEFKSKYNGSWMEVAWPDWDDEYEWRFKPEEPKFLTIIGADGKARSYPEPCKVKPTKESKYFTCAPDSVTLFFTWTFHDTYADNLWIKRGIVHLTEEAAELHVKAMLGID